MKIGIVQLDIIWKQKEKNMKKCEKYFKEAQKQDVQLLIFPEMTLTGFAVSDESIAEHVEEKKSQKSSKTIDFFREMTIKYKVAAIFGFSQKLQSLQEINDLQKLQKTEKKKLANKMMLIKNGKMIYEYQKIHPFTYGAEGQMYEGGDSLSVVEIDGHIVSGFICYDLRFPTIFQIVSKKAECIFVIANWPKTREDQWLALLKARAIENQCFVVGVNRVGEGGDLLYSGKSVVFNAAGEEVIPPVEGEKLCAVELDFEWQKTYRESFPTYLDRRDDLYQKVIKPKKRKGYRTERKDLKE